MLLRVFSGRWLLTSVLVIAASVVMVRLGMWQLDRMGQRQAFNTRVQEQLQADPLVLDESALDLDLYSMEYRQATVTGTYLPEDEIVLRNQVWEGEFGTEFGVALFTPLRIEGTDAAVLVERGWIPQDTAGQDARTIYRQDGSVTLTGRLRRAETDFNIYQWLHPDPKLTSGQSRLDTWNNINLERISSQMDTALLPVYLQLTPQDVQTGPPYAIPSEIDLSDGPHLGYAIQWFTFAILLLIGYPLYVRRQEIRIKQ
jgi:surfeit locus 1 family protein